MGVNPPQVEKRGLRPRIWCPRVSNRRRRDWSRDGKLSLKLDDEKIVLGFNFRRFAWSETESSLRRPRRPRAGRSRDGENRCAMKISSETENRSAKRPVYVGNWIAHLSFTL